MSTTTMLIIALGVATTPFELYFVVRMLRRSRERRAAGAAVTGTDSYVTASEPRVTTTRPSELGL